MAQVEVLQNNEVGEEVQANGKLQQEPPQEASAELPSQEVSELPQVESNRIEDLMNSEDDDEDVVVNNKPDIEEDSEDEVIEEPEEEPMQANGGVYKIAGSIGVSKENGSIVVEKIEESQQPQESVEDTTLVTEEDTVAQMQEPVSDAEPEEVQPPAEMEQASIEQQPLVQEQMMQEASRPPQEVQQPPMPEQPVVEAPQMPVQEQAPIQEQPSVQERAIVQEPIQTPVETAPAPVNSNIEDFSSNMGYKRPQDVLKDWVKFTQLQMGLMDAINTELKGTAVSIEQGTQGLNDKFKALADASKGQGDRIERVAHMMHSLDVNGETLSLVDSIGLINRAIDDATDKILYVSKKAMSMVYALEAAQENLSVTESFIGRVQKITKQTNLLSLNATIEAKRAGDAGKGFEVVADEVRALSKEISSLSEEMSSKIGEVVQSVSDSFVTLNEVATVDMSDNILVKEKIDYIMKSILEQSDAIEKVLMENVEFSKKTSTNISGMTMDMQFSDKASQYLNNISNIIELIKEDLSVNQAGGIKSLGIEMTNSDIDNKTAEKIISTLTLSQLKKDFIEFLVREKYINSPADVGQEEISMSGGSSGADDDDDDIELF